MAEVTNDEPAPTPTRTGILAIKMLMMRTFKQAQDKPITDLNRAGAVLAELQELRTKADAFEAGARGLDPTKDYDRRILDDLTELLADMDAIGTAYFNIYQTALEKEIEARAYKDSLDAQEVAIRSGVIAEQKAAFQQAQANWMNATFHRCPVCHGWNYGDWCLHCHGYRL